MEQNDKEDKNKQKKHDDKVENLSGILTKRAKKSHVY